MPQWTPIGRPAVCAALLLLSLILPFAAEAAIVTLAPAGSGVYVLQGSGFERVSAMSVTVRYDTSSIGNPRVMLGQLLTGALTQVNATTPGLVRIVLVSLTPIQGDGPVATMIFDQRVPSTGPIMAFDVRLSDLRGSPLPAVARIEPDSTPVSTVAAEPNGTSGQAGPAEGTPVGSVQQAANGQPPSIQVFPLAVPVPQRPEPATPPTRAEAGQNEPRPAPSEEGAARIASRQTPFPSDQRAQSADQMRTAGLYQPSGVLDRIEELPEEPSLEGLLKLFREETMIGWRQDPPVVLSDGKTPVTVTFLSAPGSASPDIAVLGATLVALERDPENTNTWNARLLPARGTWRAYIAVGTEDRLIVYPLTVAPVLMSHGHAGIGTENDLRRYVQVDTEDLNGDGRRDRIDAFVAAANYLAKRHASPGRGNAGR